MRIVFQKLLWPLLFLALTACSYMPSFPYKIDIQQGNVVTKEMVAKLKPGMTRSQVRFALGTPLVTDAFHADRWDYIYRMAPSGRLKEEEKLSVFFNNDRLTHIQGDFPPLPAFSEPIYQTEPGFITAPEAFGNESGDADDISDQNKAIDFMQENRSIFYEGQ